MPWETTGWTQRVGSRPHKRKLSDPGNGGDRPLPEQSESQLMRRRGLVVRSQVAVGCGETGRAVGRAAGR